MGWHVIESKIFIVGLGKGIRCRAREDQDGGKKGGVAEKKRCKSIKSHLS
jgi:hypothetical protein